MGYSLRYEYGLFKQKIVDGWQIELPDVWLPGGEAWLTQRTDKSFIVRFNGQMNCCLFSSKISLTTITTALYTWSLVASAGVTPNKEEWRKLMYRAATTDFSWKRSAKLYEALYLDMLK